MKLILTQAPKGSDPGKIVQAFADKGYVIEGFNEKPKTPETSTVGERVSSDIQERGNKINEMISGEGQYANQSALRRGTEATAEAFGAIPSTAINVMPEPVRKVISKIGDAVGWSFNKVVDKISNTDLFKEAATSGNTKGLEDILGTVGATGDIAGSILAVEGGAKGLEKTATKVVETAPKVLEATTKLVKDLTTQSEAQIEQNVFKSFNKGVKPTVTGKQTASSIADLKDNVVSGVKTIQENKANLQFTDDLGDVITGQTPKSLQQLADSIEQTKKSIFNKYDSLAKDAKKSGVTIDTQPVSNVLDEVINNKALNFSHPEAVKYAKDLKVRLAENQLPDGSPVGYKKFDTSTAQDIIQNYNKSLEAFYKNPSYDNASKAAIDAAVANNMRVALDKAITEATGTEYSALKKQYGALKSIEKDVVKATIRDARKNVKGLIDFTDVLSGGQVVNGILSLNPGLVASGVTQKALAQFYKYLNNPNRAIEKMFSTAEKLPQ